jgi:hypothetical protein
VAPRRRYASALLQSVSKPRRRNQGHTYHFSLTTTPHLTHPRLALQNNPKPRASILGSNYLPPPIGRTVHETHRTPELGSRFTIDTAIPHRRSCSSIELLQIPHLIHRQIQFITVPPTFWTRGPTEEPMNRRHHQLNPPASTDKLSPAEVHCT